MPEFTGQFRLVIDPLEQLPDTSGVYLLYEKKKLLYVRSTEHLRHGVELHRNPKVLGAITEKLWKPNPTDFIVSYEVLLLKKTLLQALEKKIVEELNSVQGHPVDIGGYYFPDRQKVSAIMRPSATFNAALEAVAG